MSIITNLSSMAITVSQPLAPPPAPPCAKLAIFEAHPKLSQLCAFDKTATGSIIAFEVFIIVGWIASFIILSKFKDKIWRHYAIMAIGVFIFEFFTSPMWNNYKMGQWAYVYQDVSWILTIGWSALILSTVIMVDHFLARLREWQRFALYLVILTVLVFILEAIVIGLGMRSYAPEVQAVLVDTFVFNVPIEGFYYIPVFMALVISFYKYWSLVLDDALVVPVKKKKWVGSFIISVLGVFLFELMIEPMVINAQLPAWSYIYRDVSFLMTGLWVVIIWLSIYGVDRFLIHFSLVTRFLIYLGLIGLLILPVESWFINNGYRLYGPSATANFTGFETIITRVPVEVAFAIPLYLSLVIAFVRYWEINMSDSR
jgi:hypothetical protein